ncbi:MAG: molybdopterin-dependent oxidoreductase [Chloroflexota bacterium]
MIETSRRVQNVLSAALTGAIAVIVILAVLLPIWIFLKFDYVPKLASDFIIERTPPDNAIALQNALGPLAFPSAFLGGVMFTAMLGLLAGLVYAVLRPRSRWLATLLASLTAPAAIWFCFPNMTAVALIPLLFTGLIVDRLARNDPPAFKVTQPDSMNGISRRQALTRLAMFSLGGLAVSAVGGLPVYLSELRSRTAGRRLFDFTPPPARVTGFDLAELSPEITPVADFYKMRKFATPIPTISPDWKLTIDGSVSKPLSFTFDDLLKLPRQDVYLTRQCVSNPVGGNLISTAYMSGVSLAEIVKQAGVGANVVELVCYGRDGYSESLPLDYALEHGLLTYAMNGVYLPESHGAPVRVEVPGLYGFKNMKWLDRIEAVDQHYVAIWEQQGWTKTAIYKTMSRIDTISSTANGAVIAGVAFAGLRGISCVEVQINGGEWQVATLHIPPLSGQTWVQWRLETIERGKLTAIVRATDGTGIPQIAADQKQFPDGASGYHSLTVTI